MKYVIDNGTEMFFITLRALTIPTSLTQPYYKTRMFLGVIIDNTRFVKNEVPRFMNFEHCRTRDGRYFCPNSPGRIYKNKRNLKRHLKEFLEISTNCHLCGDVLETRDDLFVHLHKKHTASSLSGSEIMWFE